MNEVAGHKISALLMDVDGTLTDGRVHISAAGECFKSFHVKDGYGIRWLLPQNAIIPVIVTGRISEIVAHRARELGISAVYQGIADKAACVQEISAALRIPLKEMAFIGDDLNDLSAMRLCGVRGCPADAVGDVRAVSDFISEKPGGQGAVREFIEWLINIC